VAASAQQVGSRFSKAWGPTPGKQFCRNGAVGPGGHQADHEPATCPHGKGSQQPPGLH